jgi:hypothetical protein
MRKWRGSREYIDGVKAFVRFAVSNSRNKDLIVCPCKKCCFRKTLREQEVFDHLTAGSGILPGYTDWIWHGEKISAPLNREPIIEDSSSMPANKAPIPDEETTMGAMLHDVFGMHDVRTDEGLSEMGLEAKVVEEDQEADDDECAKKFFNLLKDAEKPLHENTRHSKLGAIVHLYNLKCMGGWSNSHFSSLLEFINQLLGTDRLFCQTIHMRPKSL